MDLIQDMLRQQKKEYPAFYEEHIGQVISAYMEAKKNAPHCVGFAFITDIHIHLNGRASVPLLLKIGENTDIKTVLCGGDHCWAFGSKAQCLVNFSDSLNYMDPLRETMNLYHARGNHDCTVQSSFELATGYTMPYDVLQQTFASHSTPASGSVPGKLYYFADDADNKIRYIILDTSENHLDEDAGWGVENGMHEEQLQWLANVALQLPDEDWAAVAVGHIPCTEELCRFKGNLDSLRIIMEAFKNKTSCDYADFTNVKGELVAYLCGHTHRDASAFTNGLLHVNTGCDAYCKDDGISRDVGRTENTLFDIFILDRQEKTLRTLRVGAGKDRFFYYDSETIL